MPTTIIQRWKKKIYMKILEMMPEKSTKEQLYYMRDSVRFMLGASHHIERDVHFVAFNLVRAADAHFEFESDLMDEIRDEKIMKSKEFTEWCVGLGSRSITDLWTMVAFYRDRVWVALDRALAVISLWLSELPQESEKYPEFPGSLQILLHEYALSAARVKYILSMIESSVGVDPARDGLRELISRIDAMTAASKGFPDAPVPRDYAKLYVNALVKMVTPSPKDLEEATGVPASKWRTLLLDPIYVGSLKKELHKRQSKKYSKVPETKTKWQVAEAYVDTLVDKIMKRKIKQLHFNEGQKIKGTQSRPDGIDPDVGEVIDEEMERDYGQKKSSHQNVDDEEQ